MRHNERNYERDNRNRSSRSGENDNLSNYQSRYENRGNYYGMPDQGHEYRNVSSQGRSYGDQSDRHTQGQMHQNEWGGNSSYSNRDRDNDNYGSGRSGSSQGDHYRYGDPNPYMNYQRQGGYERDRGTGWRSEGVDHANRRYERQENSYRQTGHGRRFDQYGQDERYNYAHGQQDGRRTTGDSENLDDRYIDRGEHSRSSSDNDYGRQYGSNYDHRNQDRQGRNDNYESRSYRDRDRDDSPNRSPRGYGHSSGPDYSANSPISNYGPSVRGYQK